MGVDRVFKRGKPARRPRKSGAARKRRDLEHKRRLMKVGYTEAAISKMSAPQIRAALKVAQKKGLL